MKEEKYLPNPCMREGQFYDDKDYNMGSYQTSAVQFPNPADMKVFTGNGATAEDLERGWVKPAITERPEYDKPNYYERWTEFRVPDEDSNGGEMLARNMEFRMKDRQTKGLFIRPRIPTER